MTDPTVAGVETQAKQVQCASMSPHGRPNSRFARHVSAVADLLGHSGISVTGDIYGHTSDDSARAAIEGLTGALDL